MAEEGRSTCGCCPVCGAEHSALEPCSAGLRVETSGTLRMSGAGQTQSLRPPAIDDDELIGRTLGNFRIVRMLGRGGMGTVYLGEHVAIGSRVAIKFLHAHLASDPTLVERFFAEARATNLIGHENIVSIYDLSLLPPNRYYLVMELLEGEPLSARLGKPLEPAVAVPILAQALDALQAAHAAGVIHRDLKPENIFLIRREGQPDFVKLVDFGIAKLGQGAVSKTSAGLAVGTPEFMAPEQWTGQGIDGRADLYAMGVIAYLLATGRLPFVESAPLAYFVAHGSKLPEPPRSLNPGLPAALEAAILKALAKKPEERFENAQAMRAALLAALAAPAEPVPAAARAATPRPSSPRHLASAPARASWPGGGAPRQLTTADLSRGGVFLCAEPPLPPLFTRVKLTLQHPEGEVACQGDVVRHVSPEQAQAWAMDAGFAVQFVELSEKARHGIERMLCGRPPNETPRLSSAGDDPLAEKTLEHYRKRASGDHYALLGLVPDAEQSEVRARGRSAGHELEQLKERPLSARQREQVGSLIERVNAAIAALGSPARRAEHDARTSNFRGVARCLAAGLGVEELEGLRRRFLAERPKSSTGSQLQLATANAYLANGDLQGALATLENALSLDPLNLGIHQKYWALKRRVS